MSRSRQWWAAAALLYACTNEMRFAALESAPVIVAGSGGGGNAGTMEPPLSGSAGSGGTVTEAGTGAVGGEAGAGGGGGAGGAEVLQPLGPTGPFVLTYAQECEGELGADWITYWVPEPNAPSDRTIGHTGEYMADDRVSVVGGLCIIVADDQDSPAGYDRSYTSGTINTAQRFEQTLGYFEARFKSTRGQGVWTDWRLRTVSGWPPAIGVAEIFGNDPNTVRLSNYWGAKYPNQSQFIENYTGEDFSASYHVFGVERAPTELVWYVDGIERARTTEGADQQDPRFLSLAVLIGTGAEPSNPPDATTVWPVELAIDWVRVWQRP